jgi:hypothetical protein
MFTFNYPAGIIMTRMVPGIATGVFFGDLVDAYLAIRLGKKTGRHSHHPGHAPNAFAVNEPALNDHQQWLCFHGIL